MDISVRTTSYQVEKRGWLRGEHGTDPGSTPSVTLDLTATGGFVAATHYPNGYIPSGALVGQITASKLYGLYDPAATDGRQAAAGVLFNSESVTTGQKSGLNAILRHCFVETSRLPFPAQVTAASKASLPLIDFS